MHWILVTLDVHRLKIQSMEVSKLCTVVETTRLLIYLLSSSFACASMEGRSLRVGLFEVWRFTSGFNFILLFKKERMGLLWLPCFGFRITTLLTNNVSVTEKNKLNGLVQDMSLLLPGVAGGQNLELTSKESSKWSFLKTHDQDNLSSFLYYTFFFVFNKLR